MAPMMDDDFVGTLSDDDIPEEPSSRSSPQPTTGKRKRDDEDIDADFDFALEDPTNLGDFDIWAPTAVSETVKNGLDINDIVARRNAKRAKPSEVEKESDDDEEESLDETGSDGEDEMLAEDGFGMGAVTESDHSGEEDDDGAGSEGAGSDSNDEYESTGQVEADEDVAHPAGDEAGSDSEYFDEEELEKQNAFFAPEDKLRTKAVSEAFHAMNLSRPIMKGLSSVGFSAPTPIQAKAVPVALLGKDVVGGAVTGSGKTAAFLIPILERLLYRPKKTATTRVAILMPTRELALQCFNVAKKLAAFTDITFGQAIGGLNSREQEKELKKRPDIVIATPGRFIDFMRNSSSFAVDTIEILVLDEADRMLEEGFSDELNEILTTIPKSRQTMLFSATMTSNVDNLVRVGMNRPVRLMVDAQKQTVSGLVQEFVRLRPGRESKRLGYLMYLCSTVHTDRVIIFFRQKKEAHRVRVIFALCGLKAAELHGSMSQEQRISAIEAFRSGQAAFLLATDLASRGLDIKGIETVINYEAPQSHEIYLHRVGRTARAGRTGRSCTLAAEPDRKVVKAAVKAAKTQGATIRQRTVDPKDANSWQDRCDSLADEVESVLREEKEEKVMQQTERDLTRADNIVKYEDEIKSRPKKTWFQSQKDKETAHSKGFAALNGPAGAEGKERKKGKLSNKEKKKMQDRDDRKAGLEWKKGKTGPERNTDKRSTGKEPSKTFTKGGKRPQKRAGKPTR